MLNKEKIQAELSELSTQQVKAVREAAFLGCEKAEAAAYEERKKRIELLPGQLTEIDPTIEYFA
jgi:hypothetical protein